MHAELARVLESAGTAPRTGQSAEHKGDSIRDPDNDQGAVDAPPAHSFVYTNSDRKGASVDALAQQTIPVADLAGQA